MDIHLILYVACALAPVALMVAVALLSRLNRFPTAGLWRTFQCASGCALALAAVGLIPGIAHLHVPGVLQAIPISQILSLLVQLLGTVIGGFSARYLQGEAGQRGYLTALATLLAAVHVLLLADHWLILIAAWATVGAALHHLLCFYPDRPFALLAAHKKRIADRGADALLLAAAALAWREAGSGALSALWQHIARYGMSPHLQISAVALVLAVILRTAVLPVHGWLTQVMEAPTPVSALLHAGVVNLGGFVLIRFAPMLGQAAPARLLLLVFGLTTAVLAGMVMLTRVSIKVQLAWSTAAQMGFMLLECALGLYTLAALHLIGHSLYKAHAFLSASNVVRQTRRQALHDASLPSALSLAMAPVLTIPLVLSISSLSGHACWPWWWSALLGLAWAPLLWLPARAAHAPARSGQRLAGLAMVAGLTGAALAAHALPLGLQDTPHSALGLIALIGMTALYLCLALLQRQPALLSRWRRWNYAGFYVDEAYTRLALHLWPTDWTPKPARNPAPAAVSATLADLTR